MKGKSRQITHAYLFFTFAFPPATFSGALADTVARAIIWASRQSAVCAGETAMAHAHSIITACAVPGAILRAIHLQAQSSRESWMANTLSVHTAPMLGTLPVATFRCASCSLVGEVAFA